MTQPDATRPPDAAGLCTAVSSMLLLPLLFIQTVLVALATPLPILPAHLLLRAENSDPFTPLHTRPTNHRYPLQMRPSPSDDLPVEPPTFQLDKQFLPTDDDLSPRKLRKLLGTNYDPAFMSSVRPLESIHKPNGTLVYDLKEARKLTHLPDDMHSFSIEVDGHRKRVKVRGRKTQRRLLRFLSLYSYCPLHYQWKDLGPRFWPRWIREGMCYNGRSCSIPAGMSCQPRQSAKKTILLWHCYKRKHRSCRWIAIKYPIITRCSCRC